jgi:hypothetical protein
VARGRGAMEADHGARGRPEVESDGTGRQPTEGGGGRREGQAGQGLFCSRDLGRVSVCPWGFVLCTIGFWPLARHSVVILRWIPRVLVSHPVQMAKLDVTARLDACVFL